MLSGRALSSMRVILVPEGSARRGSMAMQTHSFASTRGCLRPRGTRSERGESWIQVRKVQQTVRTYGYRILPSSSHSHEYDAYLVGR